MKSRIDKSQLPFGFQGVTEAPGFLKWLAPKPCVICHSRPVDVAHLRLRKGPGTGAGRGQKNDRYAMPLCRPCHREQHRVGERVYWRHQDPHGICDALWFEWKRETAND